MKIVIDIPEKDYYQGTLGSNVFRCYSRELDAIIYNGTVLPKNHGRLIDADILETYVYEISDKYCGERQVVDYDVIKDTPTIIEADEEAKE